MKELFRKEAEMFSAAPVASTVPRAEEKTQILAEILELKDQQEALEACIASRKERLRLMMSEDGDRKLSLPRGTASFTSRTVIQVTDKKLFADAFSKDTLMDICKPTVAFIEAAKKSGVNIDPFLAIGYDEQFKVDPSRSAAVAANRDAAIGQSILKYENKVKEFSKKMKGEGA